MSADVDEPACGLLGLRTGPATEEEKKLLRYAQLVRKATDEEVEAFLAVSGVHMSEKAKTAFYGMTPENQYRVMYEGPLTESKDSTEILYARVQRFMDMENQLKKLANANAEARERDAEPRKPKEKKASDLAIAIGKALISTDQPEEVPESERRFAAPAGTVELVQEIKVATPLAGHRKGVGGIIEALQKKYSMQKGDRARVISETKELWKLEGDKTVPKTHCNQGWKWVLHGGDETAKRKSARVVEEVPQPSRSAQAEHDAQGAAGRAPPEREQGCAEAKGRRGQAPKEKARK
eukprot:CAMPEP_0171101696 /NCGR_PEP_ID=MMETSP0766_2-20121228/55730_1 /TAXON_ID=439317 /ORGANISM="Gambierdiscus australes, Strain CAWD 149" /LENGTH=293 /DNA_ID=CAMNT_0011561817 /DNA_START=41 /DNA_END=921 /DNA_ORIENTATION=+